MEFSKHWDGNQGYFEPSKIRINWTLFLVQAKVKKNPNN